MAIAGLIKRHGFGYRDAMALTPRQVVAFSYCGEIIDRQEQAIALSVAALGAQGKPKDINKHIEKLTAEDKPTKPKPMFPPGAKVTVVKRPRNGA